MTSLYNIQAHSPTAVYTQSLRFSLPFLRFYRPKWRPWTPAGVFSPLPPPPLPLPQLTGSKTAVYELTRAGKAVMYCQRTHPPPSRPLEERHLCRKSEGLSRLCNRVTMCVSSLRRLKEPFPSDSLLIRNARTHISTVFFNQ